MDYTIQETEKGEVAHCLFESGEKLRSVSEFFDALMSAPAQTIAVESAFVSEKFFDLKTGFAGEILQKVSNYRKRLILLGNFENIESKSLRDFIFESNRTGQVVFVPTIERALELLRPVR